MNRKQIILIISILFITILLVIGVYFKFIKKEETQKSIKENIPSNTQFDYDIINKTSNIKENFLISPVSIAYALSMAKDGSKENTLKEIESVLKDYTLPNIVNIKDKLSLTNAMFVQETYQNSVKKEYINNLKDKYNAEVKYDSFLNTDNINSWIKEKTFNMIPNALDELTSDTILLLINTIASDFEWEEKFDKDNTYEDDFYVNNKTYKVPFMHTNETTYLESTKAVGIKKKYAIYDSQTGNVVSETNENTIQFEYISLMPKDNNIEEYINNFSFNELNSLKENGTTILTLPKYSYDYNYKDFEKTLYDLGIHDAFIQGKANFNNMIDIYDYIYLSKAIHKTHIELDENGSKQSASTVLQFDKNSISSEKEIIFNKPFIYLIKEVNSDNIWFFGVVYNPM